MTDINTLKDELATQKIENKMALEKISNAKKEIEIIKNKNKENLDDLKSSHKEYLNATSQRNSSHLNSLSLEIKNLTKDIEEKDNHINNLQIEMYHLNLFKSDYETKITFKILYNDAVALTGGQPLDGLPSVANISNQLSAEGVKQIAIVTDDTKKYTKNDIFAKNSQIYDRSELIKIQLELSKINGGKKISGTN